MRLAILCQWYPPEPAPIGIMLRELAQDLTVRGHEVAVVTGFPNHPAGLVHDAYRGKGFFVKEASDGIEINRCYLRASPKRTIANRLANFLSFSASSLVALLRMKRPDVLLVVSPPLSNGLVALVVSRIRGIRFVFNVQDIYPDAAIAMGVIRNRLLIRVLRKVERAIYRSARMITVISPGFRENLLGKGVPDRAIAVIHNWLDSREIVPMAKDNEFSRRHGLRDKYVVLYSGTIGMISGAEILVGCAERLAYLKDMLFLFVGEGVSKDRIMREARTRNLGNVKFLPLQDRSLLSSVLSSADVSVVTLRKGAGRSSVPSKVLGYMAAGRPIVASVDPESDTRKMIDRAGCGICVPPEDEMTLANALVALYRDARKAGAMGDSGRRFLADTLDRRHVTAQYEDVLVGCTRG